MFTRICAVGDCNTLGSGHLRGNSYPERIGKSTGARVINLGHTMATSREGKLLLRDYQGNYDCMMIQFGLADSYLTCRYSPYVLYYPDNIFRKPLRSLIKKIKKGCRRTGFAARLGIRNVVSPKEYETNIREMINNSQASTILLIDTLPHHENWRNSHIQKYNGILTRITKEYDQCVKIDLFDIFMKRLDDYYQDVTHCNDAGYTRIAQEILQLIESKASV